jgi:hypothetical protein
MVKYLVEDLGADLEAKDENGETPLVYALKNEWWITEYLLEQFIRIDSNSSDATGIASTHPEPANRAQPSASSSSTQNKPIRYRCFLCPRGEEYRQEGFSGLDDLTNHLVESHSQQSLQASNYAFVLDGLVTPREAQTVEDDEGKQT